MSDFLLGVDTTGEFGSLALLKDGTVLEEIPMHSPEGFGHILFDLISVLLSRHGIGPRGLGCFAAASGPGSFTGVRIGLAAVKGLAEAAGAPAVAVSNLRALASFGEGSVRAALIDARRGEIYGGVYDSELNPVAPEVVTKFPDWTRTLPEGASVMCADTAPFTPLLPGRRVVQAPRALAAAVGQIAWRDWRQGNARDPAALDANYVRRSDAELFWKDG